MLIKIKIDNPTHASHGYIPVLPDTPDGDFARKIVGRDFGSEGGSYAQARKEAERGAEKLRAAGITTIIE